jgi:crotonobetainyl-CoA:carnitine CoA-transferase CaiB-like acyl-CoA transferase
VTQVLETSPLRPLEGVRVVDLTTNMSGPLATMVLAEQGADVVKVEPLAGDLIRSVGTGRGGMSAYFANLNRGKRSIALDLAAEAGREVVLRLAGDADVFVQNFRPGVVERLGVGPDDVMARNPGLVYASISGFGRDGPRAAAPAYDHVVQALAGFCAQQGDEQAATMIRQGVIDKATSYTTAQAVTAALLARTRTGRGTRIDVSMLDVALAFLWPDAMMNHTALAPEQVLPPVARSFRVTPTADGFIALVTLTPAQWSGLVEAMADADADSAPGGGAGPGPDLTDTAARMKGGAEIMRAVRRRIAELPTAEVLDRLARADVPNAPVLALDELHLDPQIVASGTLVEHDHPIVGPVRQPAPAARFDEAVTPLGSPAPAAGAHGREILRAAGYADDAIDRLAADGVVLA